MSGTDAQYGGIGLCGCYAVSGTDAQYCVICLRARYAVTSTDVQRMVWWYQGWTCLTKGWSRSLSTLTRTHGTCQKRKSHSAWSRPPLSPYALPSPYLVLTERMGIPGAVHESGYRPGTVIDHKRGV
eukprot:999399-Rhodomonas_salina.3